MVGVPDFASGAMENWGLIPYKEIYLVYNKSYTSTKDIEGLCKLVVHEISHQVI